MTLTTPPINDLTLMQSTGRFTQTWIKWFLSVYKEINTISGGGP